MRLIRLYPLMMAGTMVAATGCAGWRPHTSAGTPPPTGLHGDLRVTRNDNTVVLLQSATVLNDSIIGFAEGTTVRIAIASSDVRSVDRREISPVKTAGLTIGTVLLVSALAVAMAMAALLSSWH